MVVFASEKGKPVIDLAGNLLAIPIRIVELVRGVRSLRREDADRTAELFRHISEALAAAAADIREGRIPHGVCGQLMTFAGEFKDATSGVLEPERAEELSQLLYENYNIEMFAARLEQQDEEQRAASVQQLEESSGKFLALVHIIRTKA